eukprot:TRINITY_DN1086_c1_g1_i3.p1 TRINITY_DN1086_c1_g1~~TRINITY_DN1086_c1_g1_i3.p1  ORF type:complete len:623 (+),score=118.04 TRINITY_DN1086_c1_g1_i3:64-1932(+)
MATEDDRMYLLCFDQAEFRSEEEFNAAAFLVEKRKYVSIDVLAKDLNTFKQHLQEEVVHLVNTDVYDTFLSVTNKLYQRESELLRLQTPLPDMMGRVAAAKGKLSSSKEKVEEKLQLIMALEKKKAFAVQKLKVFVTEHKLRKTLKSFESTEQSGADSAKPESQRLSLLLSLVTESHQLEVCERLWSPATPEQAADQHAVCTRISELRHHVSEILREEYINNLTKYKESVATEDVNTALSKTKLGLETCLKAYLLLEDESTAVSIFREVVCDPSAEETIPWTAASGGRDTGVSKVLQRPTEVCTNHWKPLIRLAHDVGVNSLILALWQAFSDTVSKRLHFLFESSDARLFNQRYTAAHKFANALEECCFSSESLQLLRQEMKLWESRWSLDIYFKLCEIDAEKRLSSLLRFSDQRLQLLPVAEVSESEGHKIPFLGSGFTYVPAAAVYSLVMWCGSKDVVLYPLGHKILKLCLGVVDSLRKWVIKWIEANKLPILTDEGESSNGEDPRLSEIAVTETMLLDLHLDITLLSAQLRTNFKPMFASHYSALTQPVLDPLETCMDAVCSTTTSSEKVSLLLISLVASRCIEPLRITVTDLHSHLFAKKREEEQHGSGTGTTPLIQS